MNQSQPHLGIPTRTGGASSVVLAFLAVAGIVGALVWYYVSDGDVRANIDPITTQVHTGDFVSKVLDQGEIQSSENVEIRCEVRARNGQLTAISIVPEGTLVNEGDFLMRLDSTAFEKERETQRIAVANAKANVIQAEATLKTAEKERDEYLTGTFKALELEIKNQIIDAEGLIETSRAELEQAKAVLDHSRSLHSKGFITQQQLEADEFVVKRSGLAVTRNENFKLLYTNQLKVLQDLTLEKEKVQLESNIEAAAVKLNSERDALRVQESQMAEILSMIERCNVVVPPGVSGQVVYARESRGRGDEWVLEEGAEVRESQVLIRLPNTSKMEVKALINEQNITQINVGMPASVKVDALSDKKLKGVVTKVNQYAESSGWSSSSIRKYAVKVKIFDPPEALKPGMNASVFIQSKFVADAIMVPLQTVYGVADRQFCLVKTADGEFETREIEVSSNNAQVALVSSGLSDGEELVMNPGAYRELMDLPEIEADGPMEMPVDDTESSSTAQVAQGSQNKTKTPTPAQGSDSKPVLVAEKTPAGRPSPTSIAQRIMEQGDTNGDGKLDAAEIATLEGRSKKLVAQADANNDGVVSNEEVVQQTKKSMKSRGGGGGGRRGGPAIR